MKRRGRQASFGLRYTGYKRFTAGFAWKVEAESVSLRLAKCLSNRACDTLLPAVPRWDPMGMGYVGRNSETELGSWAGLKEPAGCTSATVDCYLT